MCLIHLLWLRSLLFPSLQEFTANESNSAGAVKRMCPVKELLSAITSKQSCFLITAQDSQHKQHAAIK